MGGCHFKEVKDIMFHTWKQEKAYERNEREKQVGGKILSQLLFLILFYLGF